MYRSSVPSRKMSWSKNLVYNTTNVYFNLYYFRHKINYKINFVWIKIGTFRSHMGVDIQALWNFIFSSFNRGRDSLNSWHPGHKIVTPPLNVNTYFGHYVKGFMVHRLNRENIYLVHRSKFQDRVLRRLILRIWQ